MANLICQYLAYEMASKISFKSSHPEKKLLLKKDHDGFINESVIMQSVMQSVMPRTAVLRTAVLRKN